MAAKVRLTDHDLARFPSDSLFDRLARAVCHAHCLPRKELYEAWEVARRVRRRFRGGRIVDLAAGHGLLGHILLLLDDTSPEARLVDTAPPPSAARLHAALLSVWPRLGGRVHWDAADLGEVTVHADDLVVSSHACGRLTDLVLDRAMAARARVAVLPCCHVIDADAVGVLGGWLDGALAIDVERVHRLEQQGYQVWTQTIPAAVTPKNRLLLGRPRTPRPIHTPGV